MNIPSIIIAMLTSSPVIFAADDLSSQRYRKLRIDSVLPGKLDAFRNRWRELAVPLYERHGLSSGGWWVVAKPDIERRHHFVCRLAGDRRAAIQQAIDEFHQDMVWWRVVTETEANGKLRSDFTAYKLIPADFSSPKSIDSTFHPWSSSTIGDTGSMGLGQVWLQPGSSGRIQKEMSFRVHL